MSKYGAVAILAASLVRNDGLSPRAAWDRAAEQVFPRSRSSRQKGCPRGAFLGLANSGLICGVSPVGDDSLRTGLNAMYAITAVEILRGRFTNSTPDARTLWKLCLQQLDADPTKQPNSQMDVVLALHAEGDLGQFND